MVVVFCFVVLAYPVGVRGGGADGDNVICHG